MMADDPAVEAAVRRYQAARLGPSGESTEKVNAVHDLEGLLPHPAAEAFLVSLLRDPNEYDLARVEVCKAIRAASPSGMGRGYADALVHVLQSEDDALVRQWASQALLPFGHLATVVQALVERVVDGSEDLAVRHNAIASLRGAALGDAERALLEPAVSDPNIGTIIDALLRERSR